MVVVIVVVVVVVVRMLAVIIWGGWILGSGWQVVSRGAPKGDPKVGVAYTFKVQGKVYSSVLVSVFMA